MIKAINRLVRGVKGMLGVPKAGIETDPYAMFNAMAAMPNPDQVLRGMGRAEQVYFSILGDAHVIGDVRSIRGSFRSNEYRLVIGNDGDPASARALELCEHWMRTTQPNSGTDWLELMWQMTSAILTGYRAHEPIWGLVDGKLQPTQVIDRPNRRFQFSQAGEPLLISRGNMTGAPVQPHDFVISRHMADSTNPYGRALLSSCFWPWTFKTGGWQSFVKYCERHGLPWPVGRYPLGIGEEDLDAFEKSLANMLDSGYVLAPEGTGLELLTADRSGSTQLPQEQLINLSNREMSKALTGQAMVAELQGVGSRAASETAQGRADMIHDSDRDIAVASMGQIFRWMTLFNVGDGVAPPRIEFYKPEKAGKDRAETYQVAANMGARPSRSAMLEELGIPQAETDDDALLPALRPAPGAKPGNPSAASGDKPLQVDLSGLAGFEFARAAGITEDEALQLATEAADAAIEDQMIKPVAEMLARFEAEGKTLAEFKAALEDVVGAMDDEALREVLERSLSYSILRGGATRAS